MTQTTTQATPVYEVHSITASFDALLKQAPMTAHSYMLNARNDIDEMFGEGYAAKNPALVAAYTVLGKLIPPALESIAAAIRDHD
ncbi:MAG: hypothetical protein EON58_23435 [Alphaproteobacteria bacterium]|nr:MAG: hypothetical protein EON58_23435 [Alphaproteobacteria bacterium]